jgi:hypothetical protein
MIKPLSTPSSQTTFDDAAFERLVDALVESSLEHTRSLAERVAAGEKVYFGPYRKPESDGPEEGSSSIRP